MIVEAIFCKKDRAMKTKTCTTLLGLLALCFIAVPADVMAFGFGVGGSIGAGDLEISTNSVWEGGTTTTQYDQDRRSIGLIYDTNVGKDALFNYRLGISYQKMKADSSESKYDLDGVAFENDFGFGIIRNETLRFWAGPEVKVEFLEGTESSMGYQYHESLLGVGIGPVVGVNFHLGNDLSLLVKGGYLFQSDVRLFSDWDERYGFLNIGVIFRLGGDKAGPVREN